jgi:hypothetical protein
MKTIDLFMTCASLKIVEALMLNQGTNELNTDPNLQMFPVNGNEYLRTTVERKELPAVSGSEKQEF